MDVDDAARGDIEELGSQDLSVSDGDGAFRRKRTYAVERSRVAQGLGLEDGEAKLQRGELHGGRARLTAAAGGAVRLGDNGEDGVAISGQAFQRGDGEAGGSDKDDGHVVARKSSAILA